MDSITQSVAFVVRCLRRLCRPAPWLCTALLGVAAQAASNYVTPYTLTPLAGSSSIGSSDGRGAEARFYMPVGIATDVAGNVYLADTHNQTIRVITPTGQVSTLAGTPGLVGRADGTGAAALFSDPQGITVDPSGNIYVADFNGYAIRKITPAGVVTTIANQSSGVDHPWGITIDWAGNLFFADWSRYTVAKISPAGAVTKIAGHDYEPGTVDGSGDSAQFDYPAGIAADPAGNIYVSEWNGGSIRKITPNGAVTTFPDSPGVTDAYSTGLAVDAFSNLIVAASFTSVIAKIPPAGPATIVAGRLRNPGYQDGPATTAQFENPQAVAVDAQGNLLVADGNNVVRKITPDGQVSTLAGLPLPQAIGSNDGVGIAARFSEHCFVATAPNGDLLVSDSDNHSIRKITPGGVVTTLAGAASETGVEDGPGSTARFIAPSALTVDASGNIYVIDKENDTVRKITPDGTVSTVVGPGRFSDARGIAVDASGNIYVSEAHNVQRISTSGEIANFAGWRLAKPYDGAGSEDGAFPLARFRSPSALAIDRTGNIFVADSGNDTIRKITPDRVVTTIAGTAGSYGFTDGNGSAARFSEPCGMTIDDSGNLYVADLFNDLIRKITPDGTVSTLAGLAQADGNAAGMGAEVRLHWPQSIAVDHAGNIYVPNLSMIYRGLMASAPVITRQPQNLSVATGSSVQFSVSATGAPEPTFQWYVNGALFNGATGSTLNLSNARSTDAGEYTVVVTNSLGSVTSNQATLTVNSTPAPAPASTGGGGGAISAWFVLSLLALGATRVFMPKPARLVS